MVGSAVADDVSDYIAKANNLLGQANAINRMVRVFLSRVASGVGVSRFECAQTFSEYGSQMNEIMKQWNALSVPPVSKEYHATMSSAFDHYTQGYGQMALGCLTDDKGMMSDAVQNVQTGNALSKQASQMLNK